MSKLSSLRGGGATVSVVSDNVDNASKSVFDRMLGGNNSPNTGTKYPPKKVYVPSRFRVANNETKRLVILDDKFSFGMREHSLQGPDGKWTTERCIGEHDTCPVCSMQGASNPADVALLTVLDLTPWSKTDADGKLVKYEYTKRTLAVKRNDMAAFQALLNIHKTFRGLVLDMARGGDQKESASGKPTYVTTLTEDDLVMEFGTPEVLSEQGKVIRPANDVIYAFAYERHFILPSRMELERKYGIGPRAGSLQESFEERPVERLQALNLSEAAPTDTDAPIDLSLMVDDIPF